MLFVANDTGIRYGSLSAGATTVDRYHSWSTSLKSAAAFDSPDGKCFGFWGTATGEVFKYDTGSRKSPEKLLTQRAENEYDPQISAMVVMPDGNLLLSQGTQLKIVEKIFDCVAAIDKPLSLRSRMRKLVFEGGPSADIELTVKKNVKSPCDAEGEDECSTEKKVYAIKGILSDGCEFFQKTFSSGLKESKQSVMEIGDTTFEAIRAVVLYLHTEEVELNDSCVVEVAALAREFGLSWLQGEAERYAVRELSVQNCLAILQDAERLQFEELGEKCVDWVAKNLKNVRKRTEFANISHTAALQILMAVSPK
uniref:BTB domain-containing protein n=1 Tax=Chromera velia CCMP2878 TaxID=1169474 RepID=A0A0G4HDU9_9ALVE|eukprot:Cvel_6483.t1-p1 / transcript=Cvel_6483.t1 / gene=Cvel_6483 / organism=Chromera_velia_CCMP2878 / gene_product=Kelch repeat and BTB domain-containing protein 8, putative / transcript_product=Kelch repeat and BTB domain-containing protein 8, putative / location=Cvel_scaffold318:26749-27888(-) / protein_length=309 / sequence_SO=supercontig / SO=protein_coding / is_pseudo=false